MGGKNALAPNAVDRLLLQSMPSATVARRAHLCQSRDVRIAQHQTNVRMGDEPPIRIDHEGVSALAHFDLRDDVPDELEIDLRDAHTGVAAGARERHGHVRFRLDPEIYRTMEDL